MNTISRLTDWYQCIYKVFVGLIEAQFLNVHCILRYFFLLTRVCHHLIYSMISNEVSDFICLNSLSTSSFLHNPVPLFKVAAVPQATPY